MNKIDFEISLNHLREKMKKSLKQINRPATLIISVAVVLFLAACAWLIYDYFRPAAPSQPTTSPPVATVQYPVISNVHTENLTGSFAVITWETDIPATSLVEYWAADSPQKHTAGNSEALTSHHVQLVGLEDKTEYCYLVKSSSLTGGESVTAPDFFSTGAAVVYEGAEVGCLAPEFTLIEINGSVMSNIDCAGKWLILVFWHTNCSACRSQLSHLQTYYENLPTDVCLISVNTEEETDVLLVSLLKNRGVTYPVLMDRDGAVAEKYRVTAWPTHFFIDTAGIIKKVVQGRFDNALEVAAALSAARAIE